MFSSFLLSLVVAMVYSMPPPHIHIDGCRIAYGICYYVRSQQYHMLDNVPRVRLNATTWHPSHDNATLRYAWRQTAGPRLLYNNSVIDPYQFEPPNGIYDTDQPIASFIPPTIGLYEFDLTITEHAPSHPGGTRSIEATTSIFIIVIESDRVLMMMELLEDFVTATEKGDMKRATEIRYIMANQYGLLIYAENSS